MRANNILSNMKAGKKSYGCQLGTPDLTAIELLGMLGYDFVQIDGEHGVFTSESLEQVCRVAEMSGVTPIARVPNIESSTIIQYLDRGIMGILGPGITTKEDAQQLVQASRYGPLGMRGLGGAPRGAYYSDYSLGGYASAAEYFEHVNTEILVMALLEDIKVLDVLDGILSVDGIDVFWSGPKDASQSMGLVGQLDHPKLKEFLGQLQERVHAAGKKMAEDVLMNARATDLFIDGARSFLKANT